MGCERLSFMRRIMLHTHLMPLLSEMAGSFLGESVMVRDGSAGERCRG